MRCSPQAAEVVKNLALAGVGHLYVIDDSVSASLSLKGAAPSLSAYARELNPLIRVTGVRLEDCFTHSHNLSVVVSTDKSLTDLLAIDAYCASRGIKLVASEVVGVCGYVFVNLGESFAVHDMEGDLSPKLVPLLSAQIVEDNGTLLVESIEEENLGYGIGDEVEILSAAQSSGAVVHAVVRRVETLRRAVLQLTDASHAKHILNCASLSVKKVVQYCLIIHRLVFF